MERIHILIAEPSEVIRRGVGSVLTENEAVSVKLTEVSRAESLRDALTKSRPDVVVVNPGFSALLSPAAIRKEHPDIRCVMLVGTPGDIVTAHLWDEAVSPWDSAVTIRENVLRPFLTTADQVRRYEPLSQREKDIVVCVMKGMTNRQIADRLNLSHHTVSTHRRNISTKLDIHTTSGLTVYAISNKLVRLEDLGAEN